MGEGSKDKQMDVQKANLEIEEHTIEAQQTEDEIKAKSAKDAEKKVKKLEKALSKLEDERDSLKDSYQRTFSEFNNFKKRSQGAACIAVKDGMGEAVEKILPVLDNFERALEHADEQQDTAFAQGVLMVYKQLIDILTAMEVSEIPAMGEVFDPTLHHAIQQAEAEDGTAPDTVVAVVQKGYKMCDKILRHSMVIVSK